MAPTPGTGCTLPQHNLVVMLYGQIQSGRSDVSADKAEALESILSEISALEALRGQDYEQVDRPTTSKVIDALKVLLNAIESTVDWNAKYPGLPPGVKKVMTTRYGARCHMCREYTTIDRDLYVTLATGERKAIHLRCATTDKESAKREKEERAAEEAAAREAVKEQLKPLAGLHRVGNMIYRIEPNGEVFKRVRSRYYREYRPDVSMFSSWTLITPDKALTYALEFNQCIHCGDTIGDGTTRKSLAAGYGPVCAKRFGWPYPKDEKEAERILLNRIKRDEQES